MDELEMPDDCLDYWFQKFQMENDNIQRYSEYAEENWTTTDSERRSTNDPPTHFI